MEGLFGDGLVDDLCCGGDNLEEDLHWGPRLGALVDLVEFVDGVTSCSVTLFNPISPGGGGADSPIWETFLNNSKTTQDIKMKFSKFNPTLMGVIFHIMTILINLRCCHGNHLL